MLNPKHLAAATYIVTCMSANSIWRAVVPSPGYQTLGRILRSEHRVRSPSALPARAMRLQRASSTISTRASGARSNPVAGDLSPKWTGHGVLGVALAAGLLGWGIAATTTGGDGKGSLLLDRKASSPQYASAKEMEIVGVFITTAYRDIHAEGYEAQHPRLTPRPRPSGRSAMRPAPQ